MWSLEARDRASLRGVAAAVHDAYIDGSIEHDEAAGVVTVPFVQEGFEGGPAREEVLTGETWRYREYRVTFFRGRLIVRRVGVVHMPDDWEDELMLSSVDLNGQGNEVHVWAEERLRLVVNGLDVEVEISAEPGGHVQRRVGKLTGIVGDRWLDQHRTSRSARLPL